MPSNKPSLSIHLNHELMAAVGRFAEIDRRSLSNYIEIELEAAVEARKKRSRRHDAGSAS